MYSVKIGAREIGRRDTPEAARELALDTVARHHRRVDIFVGDYQYPYEFYLP